MIKATISGGFDQPTRTQATTYYEQLGQRFDEQLRSGVPRSQGAWGAEQSRLGSWASGVGVLRPDGSGRQYASGVGRSRFNYSPDIEQA